MMGDLPRERKKMMVSLWWVTYPKKDGLIMMGDRPKWRWWSHYDGWPAQMEKNKWSHCDGWPTQVEWSKYELVSLWWVTYPNGRWWSHCDGWPTQMERKKSGLIIMGDLLKWKMKSGLIVMGDLPRWKEKWSHCYGWPT
jgi:hypothetical protein